MPVVDCLSCPSFSLTGDIYFADTNTNFSVAFDSADDKGQVLACQWFLDENLIVDAAQDTFSGKISCGQHRIGVRMLGNEGWSAIQVLKFETCKVPTIKDILGADIVICYAQSYLDFDNLTKIPYSEYEMYLEKVFQNYKSLNPGYVYSNEKKCHNLFVLHNGVKAKKSIIEGSGGDYLSNEIFYRVALLRERRLTKNQPDGRFPTGHFHVAKIRDSGKICLVFILTLIAPYIMN